MRTQVSIILILAAMLSMAHPHAPAFAQTAKAIELSKVFYNRALAENDVNKKIEYYEKAINLNPDFLAAHYNLGVTYRLQKQFDKAEASLQAALASATADTDHETRLRVIYELGSTYKSLGKFAAAESTLSQARSFQGKPQTEVKIAFLLGNILFKERQYARSIEVLENASEEYPDYKEQLAGLISIIEKERHASQLYAQASEAMANGDLERARQLFTALKTDYPNDPSVDRKLAEVDSLIKLRQQNQVIFAAIQEAEQLEKSGELEAAIAIYEKLLEAKENDTIRVRLEAARQQLLQQRKNMNLEKMYAEAVQAERRRRWTEAIANYREILRIDPTFKDTPAKLQQAENRLNEEIIARYYTEGIAAMNRKDLVQALVAFENVRSMNPDFRDVQQRLQELELALEQQGMHSDSTSQQHASSPESADSLYQKAIAFIEQENWLKAIIALEKLKLVAPDHQPSDVENLLQLAHGKLRAAEFAEVPARRPSPGGSLAWVAGLLIGLLAIPAVSIFAFSPTMRARYYLLRGKYQAAASIYERLIEKNPARLWLYPTLANVYLLAGRNDEQAIKVFKMILKLNLAFPHRDQIVHLVTQKYLTDGKPAQESIPDDTDIGILEQALQQEQRRLGK